MIWFLTLLLLALASAASAQPSPTALIDCSTASNCLNPNSASSYNTPSATGHANRLILLGVGCTDPQDSVPAAPTITGWSATWTNVGVTGVADSGVITWIFRTVLGSDQTGAITIASNSGPLTTCGWALIEWTGADITSSGANAIVQSKGAFASTSTTVTTTFTSAYSSSNNRPWAIAHAVAGLQSFTPESGWTAMPVSATGSPQGTSYGAWRNDTSDTSLTTTFSINHFLSQAMVEIKAAAAANTAGGLVNSNPLKSLVNGGLIR